MAALERLLPKAKLPLEQLQQSKPFFPLHDADGYLSAAPGFCAGVDYYLDEQARKAGKPIGQLESAEEILAMMKAVDSLKPDDIIKSTLDDMDRIEPTLASLLTAWREGDLSVIQKEMVAPCRSKCRSCTNSCW